MNTNNVMNAIAKLDLEPVKTKLMHVASGEGWSRARVEAMDVEYRRFLYLAYAFPTESAAPSVDVDTFWHYHILDTVKYAADCASTFGYFLHHNPNVGLDSAPDAGDEERGGQRMREMYEHTFGVAYGVGGAAGGDGIDTQQRAGNQAAYCCYVPTQQAPVNQAAYCCYVPTQQAASAQAAYCCYVPTAPGHAAAANEAAYCCYESGQQAERASAANEAAYCCYVPNAPIRPAVNADPAAYCCYVPGQQAGTAVAATQTAYCCYVPAKVAGTAVAVNEAAYCCYVPAQQAAAA